MTHDEAIDAIRNGTVITRMMVQDGLALKEELEADPNWDRDVITDNWFKRTPEYWAARGLAELAIAEQQPFAEIALQAAVNETIGSWPRELACLDGERGPIAPDKGRYEEIVSWRIFEECETSGDAIEQWKDQLILYLSQHPGDTLWWRERPEILGDVPFGSTKPRWRVYARLRVGDAGLIAREVAERHAGAVESFE